MNVPVNNKFGVLLAEKRAKEKRAIPLLEVSKETGVARRTLYAWQKNVVDRFDTTVIEALCNYFGVTLADLLEYVPKMLEGQELEATPINNKKTSRK